MISKQDELPRQKTRKENVTQDSADILILAMNFNLQNFGKKREQPPTQCTRLCLEEKLNKTFFELYHYIKVKKKEDEKGKRGYLTARFAIDKVQVILEAFEISNPTFLLVQSWNT